MDKKQKIETYNRCEVGKSSMELKAYATTCHYHYKTQMRTKSIYPGHKSAVSKTLVFHFSPPKADKRKWMDEKRWEKNE